MFRVEGTAIHLTRGDTMKLNLKLKVGIKEYVPKEGDMIYFSLKRAKLDSENANFIDEEPLVTKAINPIETTVLTLDPADTSGLKFGTYMYDMRIEMYDGTVDTFLVDHFYLEQEVHNGTNSSTI